MTVASAPRARDLLTGTVRFCRLLRARGLAITPSESHDAVRALEVVDLGERAEGHRALRAVLARRPPGPRGGGCRGPCGRSPGAPGGSPPPPRGVPGLRRDLRRVLGGPRRGGHAARGGPRRPRRTPGEGELPAG